MTLKYLDDEAEQKRRDDGLQQLAEYWSHPLVGHRAADGEGGGDRGH